MNNNRMCFEADASSIDIKQLLQKDFLELSMRVISDANPNVNGSWFTPESMENSLDTFVNKPILGYFENGDFVSHDGEWNYDSETQMDYWDTLGKRGERILGMIRESDGVQIVDGKDGLKWIELRCCLWVQYGYKQVKRLLKDAKKAKKQGGVAKNVSVEVDILDAEKLPNGVLKINKFNLVGITILGSRNGVKVEPGIENAGLSVIDIMGKDVFEAQKNALRLAYEKIDHPNNKKGEFSNMETEKITEAQEENIQKSEQFSNENNPAKNVEEVTTENEVKADEKNEASSVNTVMCEENKDKEEKAVCEEEVCPDCGKNPCVCENKENCDCHENESSEEDKDEDEDSKEDDKDEKSEEETKEDNCKYEENKEACPGCVSETVYDLTRLLNTMNSFAMEVTYTSKYYSEFKSEYEAVVSFLERIKRQAAEDIAVIGKLISDATEEFKGNILNFEKNISEDTISSLYAKFEEIKSQNDAYKVRFEEVEKNEFLEKAKEIVNLAELDEENSKEMYSLCESGEIANIDSLKNKIALKLFEERIANNKNKNNSIEEKKEKEEEKTVSFSAPVNEPVVVVEEKTKKKASSWDTLKEYNKN